MPVPPNFERDFGLFFQCRIPGCTARCRVSPKSSGRLGDHWKKVHIEDYGPFNGREVLVKMRNADGTFSTTTFDAYANANGITYKTQDNPRPNRHEKAGANISSSVAKPKAAIFSAPAKIKTVRGPMNSTTSSLASSTSMTTGSVTAPAHQTSNLRRAMRMERQLRIASTSMASRRAQEEEEPDLDHDSDTLDSHLNQPLPRRQSSTSTSTRQRQPLKRNLSQAFYKAKANPTTAQSDVEASGSSAPPKIPFSQMLIEHLLPPPRATPVPAPQIRTATSLTEALRGSFSLRSHIKPSTLPSHSNTTTSSKKDYSHSTWCCEMCCIDFPSMNAVTSHLRDHHAVEADVVTLTPDRDIITMVLASVRSEEEKHMWFEGNGKAVREGKKMRGEKKDGKREGMDSQTNRGKRNWKIDAEEARIEIESEMGEEMQTDQAMQMEVD